MPTPHLQDEHKRLLIGLYQRTNKTVDELPYADEFENLYTAFIACSGLSLTRHDVWLALAGLRKARQLPRKKHGPAPNSPRYPYR